MDGALRSGLPAGVPEPRLQEGSRRWAANVLGRWEFRPGSAIYATFTHAAASSEPFGPGVDLVRDLTELGAPADDVVQIKVSWLIR